MKFVPFLELSQLLYNDTIHWGMKTGYIFLNLNF